MKKVFFMAKGVCVSLPGHTYMESYSDTASTEEPYGMDRLVNKWYCDNGLSKGYERKLNKIAPYLIATTKINLG